MDKGFYIFSIYIYWYSVIIVLASITALVISIIRIGKTYKNKMLDFYFWGIFIGFICARIYYVLFSYELYKDNWLEIFNIRNGGLAIYGGLIGGLITSIFFCKYNKIKLSLFLDSISPSILLAQSIGRWGNFINKEAYGYSLQGTLSDQVLFLKKLNIPDFVINGMYINNSYHHPTFFYESIWCFIGFLFLIIVDKITEKRPYKITILYLFFYSLGRFFIEQFRIDSLYIYNIRISQLLSLIILIFSIIIYIYSLIIFKKNKGNKND